MRTWLRTYGRIVRFMAYFNTSDLFVKEYCKGHPEAERMFRELLALQKSRLERLGLSSRSAEFDYDINEKAWFQRVKAVQLDLLGELRRVCEEHGLRLFLIYGSLLGAVRSGGLIPGDDDIDVALPREDYDALMELAPSFKSPYFLQSNYNDDCFYGGFMKLRNVETTAITPQDWYVDCCEGIFIDIFPIDASFESERAEHRKIRKIRLLQRLLYAKSYGFYRNFKDMPLLVWKSYKYLGKLFPREMLLRKLDEAFRAGNRDSRKVGIYTHYSGGCSGIRYMGRQSLADPVRMAYEGMDFLVPGNWDQALCAVYGPGYLAPLRQKDGLHAFYRADVPYTAYKRRFTGLFRSPPAARGKLLLVVGDEELLEEYRKRFPGPAYRPKAFVARERLQDLDGYAPATTTVIIAAFDFLSTEAALRDRGFRDYLIFIYDRKWLLMQDLRASRAAYRSGSFRSFVLKS